ncbi:MAG: CDP-diacylglycerol diphosphatase [Deltaproteobacteria bacterium]|nr:CDP-diacylglycerol diphosphatase [Deltaproteobacteria bacterium]
MGLAPCRWPRIETTCHHDGKCKDTTEVWAETIDYAIIRDHKMCGCPEGFVHGLAIPRARVTGIEDPNRPDGIWRFAWEVAQRTISDQSVIALVVNPQRLRSQDQLHVHILRLKKDARQRLGEFPASRLQDLDEVWRAARQGAAEVNLDDYGVLVAAHPDGGFLVRVENGSPEWLYTEGNCR